MSSLASRGSYSSAANAIASVDLPDPGKPPINTNSGLFGLVTYIIIRHASTNGVPIRVSCHLKYPPRGVCAPVPVECRTNLTRRPCDWIALPWPTFRHRRRFVQSSLVVSGIGRDRDRLNAVAAWATGLG